jgi:hypothetical protein
MTERITERYCARRRLRRARGAFGAPLALIPSHRIAA